MNRREFVSGALGGSMARSQQAAAARPPNVLVILFDKCRTDAIGAYGERNVHTPHIDALARSGVLFTNCYTPQALCGPARASLITGRYPHAHGLRRNVYPFEAGSLNSNYPEFIADPFRDARFRLWDNFPFLLNSSGYATGYVGKWHLGPANPGFFDYWKGFNSNLGHWIGQPHQSRFRPDVHTDQGVRFIEQAEEPFLLFQSYYTPHEPLDPPKEFLRYYEGEEHSGYYGLVSNLDWNVGRLVAALDKRRILDDTLIVLTTEHGRTWRDRPGTAEGMCVAYEEASRIPLILRYGGSLPAGVVWRAGVSLVDLMPTILAACGVTATSARSPLHGRDLAAEIRSGRDDWTRPVVLQNIPQRGIDGSYYDERALRERRFKLILRKFDVRPELRPGELYDLETDPGETRNLYADPLHAEIVREMARALEQWGRQYGDELAVELGAWAAGG
jgi:arylsulfatase A-like enzyme